MTSDDTRPLVEVRGLVKAFGALQVLRGIDLTVGRGSVTVLLGPSGSGKTTLLRCLNSLEVPQAGTVRVDDVAIDFARRPSAADLRRLRATSGMVFQSHELFPHRTALQNVTEGPIVAQKRPREEVEARKIVDQANMRVLPRDPEIATMLAELNRLAELSGLTIQAVEPSAESDAQFYYRIPVRLQLSGRYHQLAKFFYNVSRLQRAINMENIVLSDPKEQGEGLVLKVGVLATTFRRKDA